MDDYTLVKECVKGNPKAQRMLFDKFSSKMMTVCLRYTKDTSEAEDALQDGFIKIFNNFEMYIINNMVKTNYRTKSWVHICIYKNVYQF